MTHVLDEAIAALEGDIRDIRKYGPGVCDPNDDSRSDAVSMVRSKAAALRILRAERDSPSARGREIESRAREAAAREVAGHRAAGREVHGVRAEREGRRGLRIPFSFSDLGITVHVQEGDTGDALGQADTATGAITLRPGQTTMQQVCILVHEMMHLAEASLRERGMLTEDIDHQFIGAASFGCAVALARGGALAGIDGSQVDAFVGRENTAEEEPPPERGPDEERDSHITRLDERRAQREERLRAEGRREDRERVDEFLCKKLIQIGNAPREDTRDVRIAMAQAQALSLLRTAIRHGDHWRGGEG